MSVMLGTGFSLTVCSWQEHLRQAVRHTKNQEDHCLVNSLKMTLEQGTLSEVGFVILFSHRVIHLYIKHDVWIKGLNVEECV